MSRGNGRKKRRKKICGMLLLLVRVSPFTCNYGPSQLLVPSVRLKKRCTRQGYWWEMSAQPHIWVSREDACMLGKEESPINSNPFLHPISHETRRHDLCGCSANEQKHLTLSFYNSLSSVSEAKDHAKVRESEKHSGKGLLLLSRSAVVSLVALYI